MRWQIGIITLLFIVGSVSALDYKQEIKQKARELNSTQAIETFVDGYIEYETTGSKGVKGLYDIWKYNKGDCSEIAALKCVMIKAIKIDCKVVHGYVIDTDGNYYRHDWAEFKGSDELAYLGRTKDGSQLKKKGYGYWQ